MLYLDGERVATRPAEVAPPATRMHIGGIDKQHQLQAKLDEIRIDNRAWTAEEIAAIYRQETPR
jgi:hypothetical protein